MLSRAVYFLLKSVKRRWGKSRAKRFTLLLMGGNHALIDVYNLPLLAVVTEEMSLSHVPCVKAHKRRDRWILEVALNVEEI